MSLFSGPDEHAANPPETWEVVKLAERVWALRPAGADYSLNTFTTRHAAEEARSEGSAARLWRQEAAWYAGEAVRGWKPYAEFVRR